MALLAPFRALRPAASVAALVAAVPYDVVTTEEARTQVEGNALSFLHVSRAEIDLPPGTDPHSDRVYARAVANYATLKRAAPMLEEATRSVYVYRLRASGHEQTGIAACFSMDEYERDVIKKHERTRQDKEDDRTRHLLDLRAQTGPVFLVYRGVASIDAVVRRVSTGAPLYDFIAADAVQHTLWRADEREAQTLVELFGRIPALYIADGHHRAASAARARRQLQGSSATDGEWDTFLAVAFPDAQVRILPYNRVVRDLGSLTSASLLRALAERFTIKAGPPAPERRGEVAIFVDGRWHTIVLRTPGPEASPMDCLDVSRLQDDVLTPILGIGDVRSDARIDFVGGARGTAELERLVRSGGAAVALSMHPTSVDDLMAIADAGGIMPPKSTWFEPKLRDGLLIHEI
ncbi:MAG TPA: DUF1015 family protein [Vicinamibacterales bacterium]|nr:DUF1015 family protein [Vicinamibacterales bacterium]